MKEELIDPTEQFGTIIFWYGDFHFRKFTAENAEDAEQIVFRSPHSAASFIRYDHGGTEITEKIIFA